MQRFWKLIHNAIAHPIMAITDDSDWSIRFHNWTAKRAWPK